MQSGGTWGESSASDVKGAAVYISLVHLSTLESVVRSGSMTAAASELCYSVSTVSGHVSRLEHALRTPLFDRSDGVARATAAGQRAARIAAEILELHHALVGGMARRGTFRGSSPVEFTDGGPI